ncbi:DNA (cytosine-5-)-methyltransferase [Macrococcoides caseolyticum]|uniref:Cytosine-specific methyltransferase n=1 Tax=Macrococcus caseolyticus (strain JCSC5402) TaxID=458233 RepID=B9E7L6_MACCJ|nr:DNA (cytosine-5-)-methyltransferase [Macrococcus caseolyticus]ARQ05078.1 Modification methylase HhaI [Macrococcus caseolyticus]MDJ1156600.1 DNA (cytosine-5-)-methyltransferase [Macrococcus caseolyticus]PKD99324.1 DNA (cytosine-5-)-methyltransferase [Macrococcus caseolyticus]PKE18492.1 DNA (cytosine-5-)-methyltransferase [Macrococcus caseolyticus]PKE61838.1 DNA (cytosine-5-)-methyltransferase [Macrococcus caseolyticus]
MEKIKVAEMFAGVGGFRIGLENTNNNMFEVTWANQWEPSRKVQHAFDCYSRNFKTGIHSNQDITEVPNAELAATNVDMIVGGFPCQDYSVARSLNGELGMQGKKGVLFWEITRFIQNVAPKYILLENVDRLLKSPSKQRGRDFGVMLSTLNELGYDVEWRVINAADYGNAQRRRRVFIFGYRRETNYAKSILKKTQEQIVFKDGFFAKAFPITDEIVKNRVSTTSLSSDIVSVSDNFSYTFHPSGYMKNGEVYTAHTVPKYESPATLGSVLVEEVPEQYYLPEDKVEKFKYLRGSKKIERITADGHKYIYSEGGMSESDDINLPARTMLTSESSVNRSTHFIKESEDKFRTLTPVEAERLNGFPDNWTEGMPEKMRFFCMGNALVVPLITRMGNQIEEIEKLYPDDITQLNLF